MASVGAAVGADSEKLPTNLSSPFNRLVVEKRELAESIARDQKIAVPAQVKDFFVATEKDDWIGASNSFNVLVAGMYPPTGSSRWMPPVLWGTAHEVFGTYEVLQGWKPKSVAQFGTNVVKSVPPGSIFFGGSEAGRFLPALFSESHSEGRPFFTLTQNALSDPAYLDYLRAMYGQKLRLPDSGQIQKCIEDYMADAKARIEHDKKFPNEPPQLRRGEDARIVNGKVQFQGAVAVMAIHALIVKEIFEMNPKRAFFMEENYVLDWTLPHLTPHQFIFKINREKQPEFTPEVVAADREFWIKQTDAWLGPWLKTNTPLSEVMAFAKRTYPGLKDFKGDADFVRDPEARKTFSNLRCAIAMHYMWRASRANTPRARDLMMTEADFAFRQAFAICPNNHQVVYQYTDLLLATGRGNEAIELTETASTTDPENKQFPVMLEMLKESMKAREPAAKPSTEP